MRQIRQSGPYAYTYSAAHGPIAQVPPGERVVAYTADAFEDRLRTPQDRSSVLCRFPHVNPQTGPLFIPGAEPGDTLAVHIHDIQPERDFAVTALIPGFGALVPTTTGPLLAQGPPEETRILPIRDGHILFSDRIRIPCRPFLGTLGVAPVAESISALKGGYWGGNLDCAETRPGHTMLFPVCVPGALCFLGDAHAAQGDGEITGVACEIPARTTLSFEVRKGRRIRWPRIESPTHLMAVGCGRPLDDALRVATVELIDWLAADFGLDRIDAYHLLGQAVEYRIGNMVDPSFSVVARIARSLIEA